MRITTRKHELWNERQPKKFLCGDPQVILIDEWLK